MGSFLPCFECMSYLAEFDIIAVSFVFLPLISNYKDVNLCQMFQENGRCETKLVEEPKRLLENLKNINIAILTFLIIISVFFIINIFIKCIKMIEKFFFINSILKLFFIFIDWLLSLVIKEKINTFINENKNYIQDFANKDENLKTIKEKIFLFFIFSSCHFFIFMIQLYFFCNREGYRCYKIQCEDDCSFCNCSLSREIEDIMDISCRCRNCCFCCYILHLCFCFCKKSNKNSPSLRISQFTNNIDVIPKEIKEIIETFEDKLKDLMNIINKDEKETKEKFVKHLKERESKLKPQAKKLNEELEKLKKKNNEILSKTIKDFNEKELEIEKEFLVNEVNKMHIIYELGLKMVEPLKEVVLNQLKDKMSNNLPSFARNAIESKIAEIINENAKKFLDSKFGKPLKDALIKHGLSRRFLESFKNELYEERRKRRKNERDEYKIDENEFYEENNNLNFDLYDFIEREYTESFKDMIKKEIGKQLEKESIHSRVDSNTYLLIN